MTDLSAERQYIVDLARQTIGVRWRHQGRSPETGLDCAGVIIWVGWQAGYLPLDFDVQGYRRQPDGKSLAQALAQNARLKSWEDRKPGDFVLLTELGSAWPCHMGFLTPRAGGEMNLLHCWARMKRACVEVRLNDNWYSRLVGVYSFKGVE